MGWIMMQWLPAITMHILPVLDFLTGGVAEQRSVETITAYGIDSGAMKKKGLTHLHANQQYSPTPKSHYPVWS